MGSALHQCCITAFALTMVFLCIAAAAGYCPTTTACPNGFATALNSVYNGLTNSPILTQPFLSTLLPAVLSSFIKTISLGATAACK